MTNLVKHKISFHIDKLENGQLAAYFEQNSQRYSCLHLHELEEFEYFVGDSPVSDTISGFIVFDLIHNESFQNYCPYEIKVHTNLVRNDASADIYKYADQLLESLNLAIKSAKPTKLEILDEDKIEIMGWYMVCS
jgi:hypothetical protein